MRRTACFSGSVMKILASGKAWAVVVGLGTTCPGLAEPPMPQFFPANDPLLQELEALKAEIRQLRDARRQLMTPAPVLNPSATTQPITAIPSQSSPTVAASFEPRPATSAPPEHWSFLPVQQPSVPAVQQTAWGRDGLDRFVLQRLEAAGIAPNRDADRYTLIRRAAFDLTGLPPTIDDIHAFVDDPSSDDVAFAKVVDRYLASMRFGERWARHWLDVVRYADTVGRTWNAPFTYAWRYRDWVIDAFNADLPYNQFILQQIAGDLLPAANGRERRNQQLATTLLVLGSMELPESGSEQFELDQIDDQIDVVTRGFLALTVSCARCHDHKDDPIAMRDYYAVAGIFLSTDTFSGQRRGDYVAADRMLLLPDDQGFLPAGPDPGGLHSMSDIVDEQRRGGYRDIRFTTDNHLGLGVREGVPADCDVRIGGRPRDRSPAPPRGDLQLPGFPRLAPVPDDASGRLQLAGWIASSENPLTSRVLVNRVWQHLLGTPLVRTVDNFGVTGEPPSHPELLDHLAVQFVADGWSVKSLVRRIMLSRTYRLSSATRGRDASVDPDNRLLWRGNIRRLELEPFRDSLLLAAGRLTFERPTEIPMAGVGGKGRWGTVRSLLELQSPYRTVYLPVMRSLLPEMYQTFDFPDPAQIQGQRDVTTVAPQALFLMNSDLVIGCARETAQGLLLDRGQSPVERIQTLYLKLLSRPATSEEQHAALEFLNNLQSSSRTDESTNWTILIQALFATAEFRSRL